MTNCSAQTKRCRGRYALLTPDTLSPSHLPGWEDVKYCLTLAIFLFLHLSDKATL